MFNFSGKGDTGFFSSGNGGHSAPAPQANNPTIRNPDNGKEGSVKYWFDYAQEMKKIANGHVKSKDEVLRIAAERRAVNAGLRAVIRNLLKILGEKDPTNPLLDKKNRDRLFAQYEQEEMYKILKANPGAKPWKRERPAENTSE